MAVLIVIIVVILKGICRAVLHEPNTVQADADRMLSLYPIARLPVEFIPPADTAEGAMESGARSSHRGAMR